MAEEKKDTFPWIQLIATVGTILAALIGITPYLLKLNTSSAPQTPTIVILTLPPAVTTPAPATTPVTPVETTPVTTPPTVATTIPATTGPPPTGNETVAPTTAVTTVATTTVATTAPTTAPTTLPPGPAIQISVNTTSVARGGFILASGSTDPSVPQVMITLRNSTTFQSAAVPVALTQGMFQFEVGTAAYAPGDYIISAAIPDTSSVAEASFVITPA